MVSVVIAVVFSVTSKNGTNTQTTFWGQHMGRKKSLLDVGKNQFFFYISLNKILY